MIDFYGKRLNTYKAALHNHTTTSDGQYTPDGLMEVLAKAGFDVVALTDHYKINRLDSFDHHGMLQITGAEVHPFGGRIELAHLLCLDLPEELDLLQLRERSLQEAIDFVNAHGGICYFPHPYWTGHRAEEAAALHGIAGIEVFNTASYRAGRDYNMEFWDNLCDLGSPLPALAVDDTHRLYDACGGWSVICCEERTRESVLAALRSGSFYSSQGPEFTRISYENGIFEAEFTPVTSATVISNQCRGACIGFPNYMAERNRMEVTSIRFDVRSFIGPGKAKIRCRYLRCQIVDAAGRYAWTNPIPIVPEELPPIAAEND